MHQNQTNKVLIPQVQRRRFVSSDTKSKGYSQQTNHPVQSSKHLDPSLMSLLFIVPHQTKPTPAPIATLIPGPALLRSILPLPIPVLLLVFHLVPLITPLRNIRSKRTHNSPRNGSHHIPFARLPTQVATRYRARKTGR
jgi:hypothetical protein